MKRRAGGFAFAFACACACACATTACGEPAASPGANAATGGETAACDGRGERLAAGADFASGELSVTLRSLVPESPIVGDNTWVVKVERDGEPLTGAELSVRPWMPDHGHSSTKVVSVTELEAGAYELTPLYLQMVGYWEIGVDIRAEPYDPGQVRIDACLEHE
jgi:hypothetical protein